MKIKLKFGGDNSHVLIFYVLANFIIMNIFDFSLEKFMFTNPLVRVINSALVTSLLFDFLHFAFKSFACFTARFLVSNRRKRNVTRRACKIKGKKTEPFFNVGGHHFWQFWKKETSELWFLRWIFRDFFDNFKNSFVIEKKMLFANYKVYKRHQVYWISISIRQTLAIS